MAVVAEGATNAQTAQRLDISVHTVKVHLSNVYNKLDVESRTEATTLAIRNGWIQMGRDAEASSEPMAGETVAPVRASWLLSRLMPMALAIALLIGAIIVPWWGIGNLVRERTKLYTDMGLAETGRDRVEAKRWAVAGPLQTARSRLAVVAFEDSVLAIGGETIGGVTGLVEALSPVVQVWEPRSSKPTPVSNASAAVIDGLAYVPGGYGSDGKALSIVEAYDPLADRWTAVASMPEARFGHSVAAIGGELYVFGGFNDMGLVYSVLAYDPQTDRWRDAGVWEEAVGFSAVAILDKRAYVLGGYDGVREYDSCWVFEPDAAAPWTRIQSMGSPRGGAVAAALEGRIYVFGGGWVDELLTNEQYDMERDAWEPFASPILGTWRTMGAALVERGTEEVIYVAGGWGGGYLAESEIFRPFYIINLPSIP